jgi:hypothetical protein
MWNLSHTSMFNQLGLAGPFSTLEVTLDGRIELATPRQPRVKAYVLHTMEHFTKAAEFLVIHCKQADLVKRAMINGWCAGMVCRSLPLLTMVVGSWPYLCICVSGWGTL